MTRNLYSRISSVTEQLRCIRSFLAFLFRSFMQDRVLLSAGSLAFQTLLSLVPLMAVILSVLSVSPVFDSFKRYVEEFIVRNFIPASGVEVQAYLWQFISKTSSVTTIGGISLLIIALFLISTIDHTINRIWGVDAPRKFFQGFTLYWTVLTLGPIFIGSSLVATSYVWYTIFTEGALAEVQARMLLLLPVMNTFLAFFLLYILVPNRKVKFVHAFSGAMLATVLFEFSKRWFSFYVTHIATFEHIYGALSVIPLLFFWIYLIWVVALSGAEFVYCLGAIKPEAKAARTFHPMQGCGEVLLVIDTMYTAQLSGISLTLHALTSRCTGLGSMKLRRITGFLLENHLIYKTAEGSFALSADLHTLTLYDLYATLPADLLRPEGPGAGELTFPDDFPDMERTMIQCLQQAMNKPVAAFLNTATRIP